jgi:hypothetical protein
MRIILVKTVQNQLEHRIGRFIAIVGNRNFLHLKPYGLFYLTSFVIYKILRFSPLLDS